MKKLISLILFSVFAGLVSAQAPVPVQKLVAGNNITLTPSTGIGTVKIDAAGGGGAGDVVKAGNNAMTGQNTEVNHVNVAFTSLATGAQSVAWNKNYYVTALTADLTLTITGTPINDSIIFFDLAGCDGTHSVIFPANYQRVGDPTGTTPSITPNAGKQWLLLRYINGAVCYVDSNVATVVSDTPYDPTSWDGVLIIAPSKNAVRDKIETLAAATTPNDTAYNATTWDADIHAPTKNAVRDYFETLAPGGVVGATHYPHRVVISMTGNGSPLTAAVLDGVVDAQDGGTLTSWSVTTNPADTITIDILRAASGSTSFTSIVGGSGTKPNVTANGDNHSSTFTSWTSTTITAYDKFKPQITAVGGTCTTATVTLNFQ